MYRKNMSQRGGVLTGDVKADALKKVLELFFQHQIRIKMFHFQTTSYAAHKATDAYLTTFALTFDKFMEVAQGIPTIGGEGRKVVGDKMLIGEVDTVADATELVKYLDEFVDKINDAMGEDKPEYRGLANIRDEIIGDAQQLAYLLKFQ